MTRLEISFRAQILWVTDTSVAAAIASAHSPGGVVLQPEELAKPAVHSTSTKHSAIELINDRSEYVHIGKVDLKASQSLLLL